MKYKVLLFCVIFFQMKNLYAQEEKAWYDKDGLYFGLGTGTWFPTKSTNPLKTSVFFNFTTDLKKNENAFGFSFDLIFLKTREPLSVRYNETIINDKKSYGCVNITFDYGREFYQTNRFSFEAITGVGYGEVGFYNPNADIDVSKGSFLVNPGVNVRYLMSNKYFLQFRLQYNIANYNDKNKVLEDLKGQYVTAKIIFGSCIN